MIHKRRCLVLVFMLLTTAYCFSQNDKQEVLGVVNTFFDTMETKDSIAFNSLFLENAYAYSVRKQKDSSIVRSSILQASSSTNILKERLREEEMKIHVSNKVACVWAPYDFWINDAYSHFGYEVFTLIKIDTEWKIASLTYSVEKE